MSECVILFADLAGYTALTEAHGDADAVAAAQRFLAIAQESLHDDTEVVKTIGDAVMIRGADGACTMATAATLLHAVESEPRFPAVRVGIHAGSVIEVDGDLFGATVNIAARLASHAPIGQALVTEQLVGHAHAREDVRVRSLGTIRVKNVRSPLDVYAVEHACHAALTQVTDPVCRMLIDPDDAPGRLPWNDAIWHFCSWQCASAFVANPDDYVSEQGGAQ